MWGFRNKWLLYLKQHFYEKPNFTVHAFSLLIRLHQTMAQNFEEKTNKTIQLSGVDKKCW